MPQSVVIAYQGPSGLPHLAAAFNGWEGIVLTWSESQIQITVGEDHQIVITGFRDPSFVAANYEDNEDVDADLRHMARSLNYVSFIFREFSVARDGIRRLLEYLVMHGRCWVDSDYGWVRTGEWFLARLRGSLNWDWRVSSPADAPDDEDKTK